jgi:hypothetical protein
MNDETEQPADPALRKFSQLHPKSRAYLMQELYGVETQAVTSMADLSKRLTNTNFATNGGGAVATLAFLESGADILLVKIALVCFAVGVISTGIQLRASMNFWADVTGRVSTRLRGFLKNDLTALEACAIDADMSGSQIEDISGKASQVLFVVGVIAGTLGFLFA